MKKRAQTIRAAAFFSGFQRTLKMPRKKAVRPVVLVPAGPACVGKTTAMKALQRALPYFLRIARDDMRTYLYKKGFTNKAVVDRFLFRASPSSRLTREYLKNGHCLILDYNYAAFPSQSWSTKRFVERMGAAFHVIRIVASAAHVKRKLQRKRFTKYGVMSNWKEAFAHHVRTAKAFNYRKPRTPYFARMNTGRPLVPQANAIAKKLLPELFPSLPRRKGAK